MKNKLFIIGNWKMNPSTLTDAKKLFNKVKKTKAIICPPFVYLSLFKYDFLGAQDCYYEQSGAYTSQVSPKMLKSVGVKYVIIGHSERRALGETEEVIDKKLRAALSVGLIPILCVGEKKGENAEKVIVKQLTNKNLTDVIIAYEPVWAIGTGNFCSPDRANKVREFIKQKFDNKILYGGSVNSKIAADYIKIGFDGLLVGGASLNAKEFAKIIKKCLEN